MAGMRDRLIGMLVGKRTKEISLRKVKCQLH